MTTFLDGGLGYLFDALRMASSEELVKRLRTCLDCENNAVGFCKLCGCLIQAKIRVASTSCPIGLWQEESASTSEPP
jgi:hypothetical protein